VSTGAPDHHPTVALIHATPAAMGPAKAAFAERFPEATLWNLLDDQLQNEASAAGGVTPPLQDRMLTLIRHAIDGGADGVLLTCSMYGATAQDAAPGLPIPVLAPDEALFAATAAQHAARIAVLASLPTAVTDTTARLTTYLAANNQPETVVTGTVIPGGAEATAAGNAQALQDAVVAAAVGVAGQVDLIVLANFSLAPTTAATAAAVSVPVLSPPQLAADVLRAQLLPERVA
jgi:hypothetical protein